MGQPSPLASRPALVEVTPADASPDEPTAYGMYCGGVSLYTYIIVYI